MPPEESHRRAKPGSSRVSLACLPCRSRHIRCDATRPRCRRCLSRGKECHYEKSRRGGLDRETLAARRTQNSRAATPPGSSPSVELLQSQDEGSAQPQAVSGVELWASLSLDGSSASGPIPTSVSDDVQPTSSDILDYLHLPEEDPLIDLYYDHFHRFHPVVLPRRNLKALLQDTKQRAGLEPLISVIRFIGSIYNQSRDTSDLKHHARQCISGPQLPSDSVASAFLAQSRLLLSIALYWSTEREESRSVMDVAIEDAIDLGMHRQEFASENGGGDPVLEESWRRTWWQLYIVDAYYAAIKRSTTFMAREVETTVDLPCEEKEYESGSIPVPNTLEDFENREFATVDYVYSSFAYLVGAMRCVASAFSATTQDSSPNVSGKVVQDVDSIVDGWFLLLPTSKRQVMGKDGLIDELMFQAHMGLHAAIIGLHRPYSDLLFNPLEIISSCSTGPPDSTSISELANVHTIRCLKSVDAQIRLMALPARPFCHSPFVICMMTAGTIPLLSACKFLFKKERLDIARHQIRMSIGCLKEMAGIWPQAAVHVRELQTIAQEVLGISSRRSGVASENRINGDFAVENDSGYETVGPSGAQDDGGLVFDMFGDEFQQAWDNMQPDLAFYNFTNQ